MKNYSNQKVIIIFGTPGSGKGTQAKLIASRYGLFNLDTGDFLRQIISDPVQLLKKEVREEKKLYESGKLMSPPFVLKFIKNKVSQLHKNKMGIVFSGSPRTYFEAFGDRKNEGLLSFLTKKYGKGNVFFFFIKTPEEEAIKRNTQRIICSVCYTQILREDIIQAKPKCCPFCGGKFIKRVDDDVSVIKTRFKEFKERTAPVIYEMKKRGYKINFINGAALPFKVFQLITRKIK